MKVTEDVIMNDTDKLVALANLNYNKMGLSIS